MFAPKHILDLTIFCAAICIISGQTSTPGSAPLDVAGVKLNQTTANETSVVPAASNTVIDPKNVTNSSTAAPSVPTVAPVTNPPVTPTPVVANGTTTPPVVTTPSTKPADVTVTPATTTTTKITPTPSPTTTTVTPSSVTNATTTTLLPSAAPAALPKDRSFDGMSFVGGMVLTCGLMAIGVVAFKYYKTREKNI